ncbi:hypothetical protein HanIR_Chr04g0165001 [Helianthus annuus]|nr:hypothetical protein HanIR_Chr04g0165001 [Helianthus annuus]
MFRSVSREFVPQVEISMTRQRDSSKIQAENEQEGNTMMMVEVGLLTGQLNAEQWKVWKDRSSMRIIGWLDLRFRSRTLYSVFRWGGSVLSHNQNQNQIHDATENTTLVSNSKGETLQYDTRFLLVY